MVEQEVSHLRPGQSDVAAVKSCFDADAGMQTGMTAHNVFKQFLL